MTQPRNSTHALPLSSLPVSIVELIKDLRLQGKYVSLAESDPFRDLAPYYSYGRHRGPPPRFAHNAAVMIGLVNDEKVGWSIPLTLRPPQMVDHAGQVSLPGGRCEHDETPWQTACREIHEELGCSFEGLKQVGQLRSIYVFASRHFVTPVVGIFESVPQFVPNKDEVAELILLPLAPLLSEDAISIGVLQRGTAQYEAPGFRVGTHFVWGATAMILGELRKRLLCPVNS